LAGQKILGLRFGCFVTIQNLAKIHMRTGFSSSEKVMNKEVK
jgi:hypothetical protein